MALRCLLNSDRLVLGCAMSENSERARRRGALPLVVLMFAV